MRSRSGAVPFGPCHHSHKTLGSRRLSPRGNLSTSTRTSAGSVPDYVNRNWFQNYGGRGRPYDFGAFVISDPPNGFLFDQATKQGIKYYNYGEAVAEVSPFPDRDASMPFNAIRPP